MSGEPSTEATTFDELPNGSGPTSSGCRRCGEPATHRAQMAVREKPPPGSGKGANAKVAASHKSDLCERCAVQLFAQVPEGHAVALLTTSSPDLRP